jgi:hypothetical protein
MATYTIIEYYADDNTERRTLKTGIKGLKETMLECGRLNYYSELFVYDYYQEV